MTEVDFSERLKSTSPETIVSMSFMGFKLHEDRYEKFDHEPFSMSQVLSLVQQGRMPGFFVKQNNEKEIRPKTFHSETVGISTILFKFFELARYILENRIFVKR